MSEQVFTSCTQGGPVFVHVKDGKIISVRPIVFGDNEDVPTWTIEANGREFSAQAAQPRGYVGNPVTREDIKDKYWRNVEFCKAVPREKAEEALAMLENLEEVNDVSEIVGLLVAGG